LFIELETYGKLLYSMELLKNASLCDGTLDKIGMLNFTFRYLALVDNSARGNSYSSHLSEDRLTRSSDFLGFVARFMPWNYVIITSLWIRLFRCTCNLS